MTLWRGPNCLFENLSFDVSTGSALLVQGPNGSGKTTLMRVLCGLTRPETGHVEWKRHPLPGSRQEFGAELAYLGHRTGLKADLTVAQNLAFVANLNGQKNRPWENYLDVLDLGHSADLEVRYLSAGQRRRAALARVLMSDASAWFLDEPFTNLDDAGRRFVTEQIDARLESGGLAVVATHHNLELVKGSLQSVLLGESRDKIGGSARGEQA